MNEERRRKMIEGGISVGRVEDQVADYRAECLSLAPEERIALVQQLRESVHGEAACGRIQRVLTVSQRGGG